MTDQLDPFNPLTYSGDVFQMMFDQARKYNKEYEKIYLNIGFEVSIGRKISYTLYTPSGSMHCCNIKEWDLALRGIHQRLIDAKEKALEEYKVKLIDAQDIVDMFQRKYDEAKSICC